MAPKRISTNTSCSSSCLTTHQREERAGGHLLHPATSTSHLHELAGQHQSVAADPEPQPQPQTPHYYPQRQQGSTSTTFQQPTQGSSPKTQSDSGSMFFLPSGPGLPPQFGYYTPTPGYYGPPITAATLFNLPAPTPRALLAKRAPSLAAHPEFFKAVSSPEMEYPPGFVLPSTPGPSRSFPSLTQGAAAMGPNLVTTAYGLPMTHQGILRTFSDATHFGEFQLHEPTSPQSSVGTRFSDPVSRRSSQGAMSTSSHGSPSPSGNGVPLSPGAHLTLSLFQPQMTESTVCGAPHAGTELLYLTTVAASQARHVAAMGEQKVCAVCGDCASCAHYGVRTCEGCKGFFKRTVQKKAQYVCMGNKDCPIDKRRRNRCQYCRFQKCISVGMVKEVVRHGSLRGRRGRLPSKTKYPGAEDPPSPPVPLITSLVRAYTDTKQPSTAEASSLLAAAEGAVSTSGLSDDRLLHLLVLSLDVIRNWADRIPGFADLPQSDQEVLLNHTFFQLVALRMAYRSLDSFHEDSVIFEDGSKYSLVHQCPENWRQFLTAVINDTRQLKEELEVDLAGFTCLCALTLLQPDQLQLEDLPRVDQLRSTIVNALKDHCTSSTNGSPKKSHYFAQLIGKIGQLHPIAALGKQALEACQRCGIFVPLPLQGML